MTLIILCGLSAAISILVALSVLAAAHIWGLGVRQGRDLAAIQSSHRSPTSRLGGLSVFGSFCICFPLVVGTQLGPLHTIVFAAGFVFLSGVLEDFGLDVKPIFRLITCIGLSLFVALTSDLGILSIGIPLIDPLLQYAPVSILVTIIITAGFTNAINMIDGVNGLASFVVLVASIALSIISFSNGLPEIGSVACLLAVSFIGYSLLNYPTGLIFLGDGGAYFAGFLLSWLGVLILYEVPSITPWSILLILFWPSLDIVFAVFRRIAARSNAFQPDDLHLHQLVNKSWGKRFLTGMPENSSVLIILLPFLFFPPLLGVILSESAIFSIITYLLLFSVVSLKYFYIVQRQDQWDR